MGGKEFYWEVVRRAFEWPIEKIRGPGGGEVKVAFETKGGFNECPY